MWRIAVAGTFLCLAGPGLAEPCGVIFQPHKLDAAEQKAEQKIDQQAPVQVEARVTSVVRGGAAPGSSCNDLGFIVIELVRVGDDRTPRERLGYRVTHVEGTLPGWGIMLPPAFRITPVKGKPLQFELAWIDGATNNQEPIDFTLAVTAVDLAGNESVPSSPIRVSHPGGKPPR